MSETQLGKRTAPVGKSRSMEYRSLYPTTRLHQEGPALRKNISLLVEEAKIYFDGFTMEM